MSLFGGGDDELKIKVSADTTDASKKVEGLGLSVSKLAQGFVLGNIATGVLTSGMNMLSGVLSDSVSAYQESENTLAQMNAVLTSTGHAAGMSGDELVALSAHFQELTKYEDEAVLGAENILLTFTSISKDIFPQATETVLNMSTALGQDLKSSSIQLGKALQDPIQGVSALQRVGVNFNETQKDTIETLVKTGHTLEAQRMILKELSTEFGGSAVAAAKTFQGQMEQLKNRVDDMEEGIGHGLTAALYNLISAFGETTKGMESNVDIGKIVFQTFAIVEQLAVNVAVGLYELGGAFAYAASYIQQGISMLDGWDDAETKAFDSFRDNVASGMDAAIEFARNLEDKNLKTAASFNDITVESGKFAAKIPAAYKESAKSASEAAEKMVSANKAVSDSFQKLTDLLESHDKEVADTRTSIGEAFVKQEQTIADLRKQLANETDMAQRVQLQNEIAQNVTALASKKDMELAYNAEVVEARRRAAETDFERTIEDITRTALEQKKAFLKKMDAIMTELVENEKKRAKLGITESAITANVMSETQKRTLAVTVAADAQVAQYARVQMAAAAAYSATSLSAFSGNSTPAITKHEFGGLVPGPQGQPRLILAHGQERVLPAGQTDSSGSGGGFVVNFNNLSVSGQSDVEKIRDVLDSYFRPLLVNYKI